MTKKTLNQRQAELQPLLATREGKGPGRPRIPEVPSRPVPARPVTTRRAGLRSKPPHGHRRTTSRSLPARAGEHDDPAVPLKRRCSLAHLPEHVRMRVKSLRHARGLTQRQLAERAGLSLCQYVALERGSPRAKHIGMHALVRVGLYPPTSLVSVPVDAGAGRLRVNWYTQLVSNGILISTWLPTTAWQAQLPSSRDLSCKTAARAWLIAKQEATQMGSP
jgi:transcriptional regulator with XRE-family HTH domain